MQQEQFSLPPGCISCSKWFNFKFNEKGLLKCLTHNLGFLGNHLLKQFCALATSDFENI